MKIIPVIAALILLAATLTACGSDPLGLAAAEHERSQATIETARIQADAATAQARINASTARVRVGGWMVAAMIAGVVVVAVAGIAGMTHIQAQRDRLSMDGWRNQLPVQPPAVALGRPPSRRPQLMQRPMLSLSKRHTAPPTLALPERSTSAHDVIVIDG